MVGAVSKRQNGGAMPWSKHFKASVPSAAPSQFLDVSLHNSSLNVTTTTETASHQGIV